jgi:hypothetical protein
MTDEERKKVQRSYWLWPEQAQKLRVRAAIEGVSQSALISELIDEMDHVAQQRAKVEQVDEVAVAQTFRPVPKPGKKR